MWLVMFVIYSVNIKFGTKFIVALCDVFWKIARRDRFYFKKCHSVTYNFVACQNATILLGGVGGPRDPTIARGTIRSLLKDLELAR
jgi:hypothetical protein